MEEKTHTKCQNFPTYLWLFCSNVHRICREVLQNFFHMLFGKLVYFVTLREKYIISWDKKVCKRGRKFTAGFFCSNLQSICRKVLQNKQYFSKRRVGRRLLVWSACLRWPVDAVQKYDIIA